MKKTIPITLLLLIAVSAFTRGVASWPEAKMQEASDLIVVGTVAVVKDLDETNTLGDYTEKFHGVETTFKVSRVLKGSFTNKEVVLHHYRFENDLRRPANAPEFIRFSPFSTNKYMLYLAKDGANRYAPVTGQIDPAFSVKKS